MITMFKTFAGRAVLATAFFALAATGCSDDSSSGADVTAGMDEPDWREHCLEVINKYRATENLEPVALADEEKQKCADEQSADDLAENKAHGHFKACGNGRRTRAPMPTCQMAARLPTWPSTIWT